MIVRTDPGLPQDPDAVRAMVRLEAQLRRAADDLADTLAVIRATSPGFAPDGRQRCLKWMRVSQDRCARYAGHKDACRTRATMDLENVSKNGRRA